MTPVRLRAIYTATLVFLAPAAIFAQVSIQFYNTPDGDLPRIPYAMTQGGTLVGSQLLASTPQRKAIIYGFGELVDLPGSNPLYFRSETLNTNIDGTVVVGYWTNKPTKEEHFIWTQAAGMVSLGSFPGVATGDGDATRVSADGTVVTGTTPRVASSARNAYRWTATTGLQNLGSLPGGTLNSEGRAISADGSTIVGLSDSEPGEQAFRWRASTGMQGLGSIASGSFYSRANAVSANGNVVVGNCGGGKAFWWTQATGMVGVAAWGTSSYAWDVSDSGLLAVGTCGQFGAGAAALWDGPNKVLYLRGYLLSLGMSELQDKELLSAQGISEDGLLVRIWGSYKDVATNQGGWYVATFPFPNTIGLPFGLVEDNSTNNYGKMHALGSSSVASNDLSLEASHLPSNMPGYFLVSNQTGFVANAGGSQGNLLLGGPVGRYISGVASSGLSGSLSLPVDLTSLPTPDGTTAVLPGDTWHFQCWHRDENPGPTSNFTQGLSITFK